MMSFSSQILFIKPSNEEIYRIRKDVLLVVDSLDLNECHVSIVLPMITTYRHLWWVRLFGWCDTTDDADSQQWRCLMIEIMIEITEVKIGSRQLEYFEHIISFYINIINYHLYHLSLESISLGTISNGRNYKSCGLIF